MEMTLSKRLLFLLMFTMLMLSSCTVTKGYRGYIELPEGTSIETAKEIVTNVLNDGFIEKISKKFPNFDPVNNPRKQGIFLYWGYSRKAGGPKKAHILLVINYVGKLDNQDEIFQYGKSIVENYVREYFTDKKNLTIKSDGLPCFSAKARIETV